jgi:hypothetical protein
VLDGDQLAERYLRSMHARKARDPSYRTAPAAGTGLARYIRASSRRRHLITADPKSGKTSLANTIAHWNAKTGKAISRCCMSTWKMGDKWPTHDGSLRRAEHEELRQGQHIAKSRRPSRN